MIQSITQTAQKSLRTAAIAVAFASAAVAPASMELLATDAAWLGPDWSRPVNSPTEAVPTSAEEAAEQALKVGQVVPNAVFTTAKGETVSVEKLLADGPVVLIFYRGGWCPYCVSQLKKFEAESRAIEEAGGRVVAVSTELPEFVAQTKEKNKLGFEVLSDPDAKAARAFGVAWANERYGKGLAKYQGNEKGEIPLGVTYVIGTDGTIGWAFLDDDYKKRATVEQVVEALENIE